MPTHLVKKETTVEDCDRKLKHFSAQRKMILDGTLKSDLSRCDRQIDHWLDLRLDLMFERNVRPT